MGTIWFFPSWSGPVGRLVAPVRTALAVAGTALVAVADVVLGWQRRAMERETLSTMEDRMLRDIGLTHAEAMREMEKPFWKA